MKKGMKIVFFGAGAIGQSVGGWIAPHHDNLYFLDRGDVAGNLKEKGITLFEQNKKDEKVHVAVQVIDDIGEAKDADVIVLGVKNFSLDAVAKTVRDSVGDGPIIIAVQNGVVLVAFFRQLRERGDSVADTVIKGCDLRFRPLFMTALVSFIGHLPMLWATGSGADIQKPLAVVVMGGLITSTILTLLVLPTLYSLFANRFAAVEAEAEL